MCVGGDDPGHDGAGTSKPYNGSAEAITVFFRYLNLITKYSQYDLTLVIAFNRVSNMVASPISLLKPNILLRVLWHSLGF